MKTVKIRIKPNPVQLKILDEWFNTSNYVYNRTVEMARENRDLNFIALRDRLVTYETKKNHKEYKDFDVEIGSIREEIKKLSKDNCNSKKIEELKNLIAVKNGERRSFVKDLKPEINSNIKNWELNTPKEIRASSVKSFIDARTSAFSNLKNGNIGRFELNYRKKIFNNCIRLQKNLVEIVKKKDEYKVKLAPQRLKENMNFKISKKIAKDLNSENIQIDNDCKIIRHNSNYYLLLSKEIEIKNPTLPERLRYCGVDPGVRTFLTSFGNEESMEYLHRKDLLKKLNKKIDLLKNKRLVRPRPKQYKENRSIRKKAISNLEREKNNYIDDLHWQTISKLLKCSDVVFFGDIKSHDIVKNKQHKKLNRDINDLKFYKFKERLLFKAACEGKTVYMINEACTTLTCSRCGTENREVGSSETYRCKNLNCGSIYPRDQNASKNILMKGLVKLNIY